MASSSPVTFIFPHPEGDSFHSLSLFLKWLSSSKPLSSSVALKTPFLMLYVRRATSYSHHSLILISSSTSGSHSLVLHFRWALFSSPPSLDFLAAQEPLRSLFSSSSSSSTSSHPPPLPRSSTQVGVGVGLDLLPPRCHLSSLGVALESFGADDTLHPRRQETALPNCTARRSARS